MVCSSFDVCSPGMTIGYRVSFNYLISLSSFPFKDTLADGIQQPPVLAPRRNLVPHVNPVEGSHLQPYACIFCTELIFG